MVIKNVLCALLAVALAAPFSAASNAQPVTNDYPNKPVKIIIPFPAGGTSDVMGRMVAETLGAALKQPFIIENIGGAGGVIGTERATNVAADGYTLVMTGVGQNAVAHGLNPNLKYDSLKDFIHISQIHHGPNVLVVHPSTSFKSFKELVSYVQANPGKLNYGYVHAASGHMAMELLKQTAKLDMVAIPYKGGGPMMTDILGGQIPLMFINQDTALQHVKAGKLRALAVSSSERNPLYPDVPTVAESGYPGFLALSWSGLSAPKGTPKAVVDKLEAAMIQQMATPAIKGKMEANGFIVPPQGAKVYSEFVKSELDGWVKVIKTAGIKAE
jgi:tripartite-type tricarboxylate transporter receptor subunit TctC